MFRRTSVVHLVDELGRERARERAQQEFVVLLRGVAWALWGVRVELAGLIVLAAVQRFVAGELGDVAGGSCRGDRRCGGAVGAGPAVRTAAAACDAGAAGVGAGNGRLGRRVRSVPLPGRVVGQARLG